MTRLGALSILAASTQLLWHRASALTPGQAVLVDGHDASGDLPHSDVREALLLAEIIPTVVDDFFPAFNLSVRWSHKASAQLGNTLSPKRLGHQPELLLADPATEHDSSDDDREGGDDGGELKLKYTVVLTDPDAPSRENPEWAEVCHWIVTGVPLVIHPKSSPSPSGHHRKKKHHGHDGDSDLEEVMPYMPPGPPPKTGKHRYVLLAFAPINGTHAHLDLSKPRHRKNWGTGKVRHGVRQWAYENGLVPVAANFVYSQNRKQ